MKRHPHTQIALWHICCACNTLVWYGRAEQLAPESLGANWPLHVACIESERRWFRTDNHDQWLHPEPSAGRQIAADAK